MLAARFCPNSDWVGAMASEVSIAGAQQDLRRRVSELEQELGEAQQREAATAELLQVINRPQFALQSVFEAIAQSAMHLCEGEFSFVLRFDGELLRFAASYGLTPEGLVALQNSLPRPAGDDTANGRAVLRRSAVQIPDVQSDPAYGALAVAQKVTYRSLVAVPLLRHGAPIGGITVGRARVGAFSEGQIRLLKNFASQAVIAIENTRLFEAELASKRELTESLEYQTAMSDVLGVISRSPNELQPVLDTIVLTAQQLCQAEYALIHTRREDDLLHLAASSSADPAFVEWVMENPIKAGDGSNSGLVLLEKKTVHWPDALAEPQFSAFKLREQSKARTMLGVPVQREGQVVAVLFLARTTVKPFSKRQIKLVETFANQAVIAIENTRLFEAEQASKRELQQSLEYQTAISEVLNVISRSPSDLQPVLKAIGEIACRLCAAYDVSILLRRGDKLRLMFVSGPIGGYPVGHDFAL